jgi:Ca-activated chloride channel family protein
LTQSISGARVLAKRLLFAGAVLLLCGALAGPQAGYRWEQITRRGNDIIFAVDTSRSMMTPDVKPNRLMRAKLAIDDLVNHLDGDAVGLVAFAGSAFLQTPITLDYGAFHESLAALDTHTIPRGGTNITSAIEEARAALQNRPGTDKILILVTDGEDLEGDSLAAAKAAAVQDGLKIFTVGVGSQNGDLIPLPPDQGGGYMKDADGQLVKSHLDEGALKAIAAATGGSYAPLGPNNEGLESIYEAAVKPLAKHDLASKSHKVYRQRYQWPLGISLLLLAASLMVGTRRRRPRPSPASVPVERRSFKRFVLPTSAALCALCALLPIRGAQASAASAASDYARGDFGKAEQEYLAAAHKDSARPALEFNAGAAAYKAGEYPQAAKAFQASVEAQKSGSAKRLAEQEDAYYNLGNTQYREGQKTARSNTSETIAEWTQAVKSYDAALQLRTADADSKFNRDLVSKKLEELKKAQSQQSQSEQAQSKQQPAKQSSQSQDPSKSASGQSQTKDAQNQPQGAQPKPQPGQHESGPQSKGPQQAQAQAKPGDSGAQGQSDPGKNGEGSPLPESAQHSPPQQQRGQPGHEQGHGAAGPSASGQQVAQAGDDQRTPGGMSRDEARDLLDSVKDEQHRAPGVPIARNGASVAQPNDPLKDW